MTKELETWSADLKRAWCEALSVEQLRDGSVSVTTPFLFGDGDAYPVIVNQRRGGWQINDGGLTTGHMQHAELGLTNARLAQLERFAEGHGVTTAEGRLELHLDRAPTVDDLADFIELIAQINGLPFHEIERESEQFRTRARMEVRQLLRHPERAEDNWAPQRNRGGLYRADLFIPTPSRPVVAFFAGNNAKVDRSVLSVMQYEKWDLEVRTVIAHSGRLSGETIYRAQTSLEGETEVIRIDDNLTGTATGLLGVQRVLRNFGVELAA